MVRKEKPGGLREEGTGIPASANARPQIVFPGSGIGDFIEDVHLRLPLALSLRSSARFKIMSSNPPMCRYCVPSNLPGPENSVRCLPTNRLRRLQQGMTRGPKAESHVQHRQRGRRAPHFLRLMRDRRTEEKRRRGQRRP